MSGEERVDRTDGRHLEGALGVGFDGGHGAANSDGRGPTAGKTGIGIT